MADARTVYAELRQPLLRTGVLLSALLLVTVVAGTFNTRMDDALRSARQQLEARVQEYRATLAAEEILRTDARRFAQLRAQGFVGPEPRLRWVEDLRAAAAAAGLVTIRYELEPRHAHTGPAAGGNYALFVSPMKLVLELHHEGDLPHFLQHLDARGGGLFDVAACSLRRTHDGDIRLDEANVSADCLLRWYSLDAPDAGGDGGPL